LSPWISYAHAWTGSRQDHHGPNRDPNVSREHYWQRWYERLPKGLLAEPKRQKVIKALQNALSEFDAYRA
jgi:hypothetical protein